MSEPINELLPDQKQPIADLVSACANRTQLLAIVPFHEIKEEVRGSIGEPVALVTCLFLPRATAEYLFKLLADHLQH